MRATAVGVFAVLLAIGCDSDIPPQIDPLGAVGAAPRPAPPPVKPVVEALWGRQVTDNYRYMEALEPSTLAWMKEQGEYASSVLNAIPARAALEQKIAALTGSLGLTRGYVRYGGRAFYEERAPGSDSFNLVVSDAVGKRVIVDLAALSAANDGLPHAINFFVVSPNGARVAVGVSQGGSEAASITVYDVADGRQIAGPLDRADPGFVTWSCDSRRLFVTRLQKLAPGQDEAEKYRNTTVASWDLKSAPVDILGTTVSRGPSFTADETPTLEIAAGSSTAIAASLNGVQNELALWTMSVSSLRDAKAQWQTLAARTDEVTAVKVAGDSVFLLSHKNAPTFQILSLKVGQPLASARVLVPAVVDRVIEAMYPASDGLYVLTRKRAYSQLLRVDYKSGAAEVIALPFDGFISEAFADSRRPGLTINLQGFVTPPLMMSYDPARRAFADLKLGVSGSYDASRYEVLDLYARAKDGVAVPQTLMRQNGANGPQIVVLQAYGFYGISQVATFNARTVSFLEAGGSYAICHVRGGGELGEQWRLAGKDANKPNSWRDLIACAEDLIAKGYTTRQQLFLFSKSAGGITVGRALTERPELFAGVLAGVPGANTLRMEFQPAGPMNIPEFGTIATEEGFRNLYAMDTIQHVRSGTQYPAVLVTTGLNDPRVSPWEPAKLAAALQASGSIRPVLLRIDAEAGHGFGDTKSQDDAVYADMWAFVFWRAGLPEWRPRFRNQ